jgi:hypothetical protein
MNRFVSVLFFAFAVIVFISPLAAAWNIPTHMITGAMAYRILQAENPRALSTVQAMLEKHPWYADRWRPDFEPLPETQRGETLFMLAARWADDIRTKDKAQHRAPWHYLSWPFKPNGEPSSIKVKQPEAVNILTAIKENKRITRESIDPERRAIALVWLFHLIGDIHQPLNTAQLFTREYPNGDRGGNDICIRVALGRQPLDLHRLWDGLITSSSNVGQIQNIATELRSKFSRVRVRELDQTQPEAWAKESYEIATKIVYENGSLRGTPRKAAPDCRQVRDANFLSRGYPGIAKLIADRRIYLAGYRLAEVIRQVAN